MKYLMSLNNKKMINMMKVSTKKIVCFLFSFVIFYIFKLNLCFFFLLCFCCEFIYFFIDLNIFTNISNKQSHLKQQQQQTEMDPFVIKATRVKTIKFENNDNNKINFILNDLNNKKLQENNFENENVLKNKIYQINDRPSKK